MSKLIFSLAVVATLVVHADALTDAIPAPSAAATNAVLRTPMEWHAVQTNAIAAWKSARHAPSGVVVDKAAREVRFLAEATGLSANDTVEFIAVGPLSDRAYESFAMTVASPGDIAAAIESVGVPRGVPVNVAAASFWPQGERMSLVVRDLSSPAASELGLDNLVTDAQAEEESAADKTLSLGLVYTGGSRATDGSVLASTNIPCAVFAAYNCGPSILQFPAMLDQSAAYGCFRIKHAFAKGALLEFVLRWNGARHVRSLVLDISGTTNDVSVAVREGDHVLFTGPLDKALVHLHGRAVAGDDLFVRLSFAPSMPAALAAAVAQAFTLVNGPGIKLNGTVPGQFYAQAYLPQDEWRDRTKRMFQPFEVSVSTNGVRSFTQIAEDWSGEGLDPVLKPSTTPFKDWSELPGLVAKIGKPGEKIRVLFIYLPKSAPIGDAFVCAAALKGRIDTFYVFTE
mgnify:CR=1 FL=1